MTDEWREGAQYTILLLLLLGYGVSFSIGALSVTITFLTLFSVLYIFSSALGFAFALFELPAFLRGSFIKMKVSYLK